MGKELRNLIQCTKGIMVENDRWKKWVEVSHIFRQINQWFSIIIQGLGRLDCELIYEDNLFLSLSKNDQETITESFKLSGRYTHSYLWVLGLYELIRTLDQKSTEAHSYLTGSIKGEIKELKRKKEKSKGFVYLLQNLSHQGGIRPIVP